MPSPSAESQAGMRAVVYGYFPLGKDSHIFQTIAVRVLLCLNTKPLVESLVNAPCCTPSMLLLPQAPQKDSEFKGFLPSVTAILLSAACSDPNINLPLATFWHCLAAKS